MFFLIFACVREIALESSSNFLAFFDKYSKNSPRKSKGSRNVIRAELRRLPIPTRNAWPNLVVGAGGDRGHSPPTASRKLSIFRAMFAVATNPLIVRREEYFHTAVLAITLS